MADRETPSGARIFSGPLQNELEIGKGKEPVYAFYGRSGRSATVSDEIANNSATAGNTPPATRMRGATLPGGEKPIRTLIHGEYIRVVQAVTFPSSSLTRVVISE